METATTTWSKFPNGGKPTAEQIIVSEDEKLNPNEQNRKSNGQGSE